MLMVLVFAFPTHQEATTIRSQFPQAEQRTAVAVMLAESHGDPNAIGPNGEKGIFQLMYAPSCWRVILCNARAAAQLWRQRGWQPWTTYTSGRYRAFLDQAATLLRGSGNSVGKTGPVRSTVSRTRAGTCRLLPPGNATFGLLAPGSSGKLVRRVQFRLRISPDGIYGPETTASVTSTQRSRRLQVDGIVGRQTACALRLGRPGHKRIRSTGTPVPPRTGNTVVQAARAYLGVPYVWGGESHAGLDCSGFTLVAYRDAFGLTLPHSADAQPAYGRRVSRPAPGDLVHWAGHVAIYYGNGRVIGARHRGTVSRIYPIYGSPTFYRMRG